MREADIAQERLLAVRGDPLVHVEWHHAFFLNYVIGPEIVRPLIPSAFELDLHEGRACISLVSVTMRNYHRAPKAPLWGALVGAIKEQRFLNFRTYVRYHDEPGAFFMWGWLSRPFGLPLPDESLGLTCAFAKLDYPGLRGRAEGKEGVFAYSAPPPEPEFGRCTPGSVAEFAMERYSGFFAHRGTDYVFRAWHEPWLCATVEAKVDDTSLITTRFPWFADATFCDATYAPLTVPVWLGRAHRLAKPQHRARPFLDMP